MERLLSVSRELGDKVQANESAAGELLRQCEQLREELKAMRQWREVVPSTEENRVQMPNIEFKYIKQLQAENAELRVLLEEHQAAIEMIMTKYRQQVGQFISAGTQEKALASDTTADELLHRTDQLYHMAAIIALTMQEEDSASQKTLEYVTQLECENKHLRELLHFTQSGVLESATDHTPLDTATPVNSPSTASSFPQSSPSHPHRPLPHFPPATDPHSEGAGGASDPHSGGAGGGYVHTATPLNSGQSTPVVVGGGGEGNTQPLLEQAIDKLNDDSRDVM